MFAIYLMVMIFLIGMAAMAVIEEAVIAKNQNRKFSIKKMLNR